MKIKKLVSNISDLVFFLLPLSKLIKKLQAGCVLHLGGWAAVIVDGRTLGFGTNFSSCEKMVVSVWDLDNMQVVKMLPVSGSTESPPAHANAPYVAVDIITKDKRARTIQLIDKKPLEIVKTLDVGGHAYFPEYNADGKYLYVSAGSLSDHDITDITAYYARIQP